MSERVKHIAGQARKLSLEELAGLLDTLTEMAGDESTRSIRGFWKSVSGAGRALSAVK